jgi:hypothetical protein
LPSQASTHRRAPAPGRAPWRLLATTILTAAIVAYNAVAVAAEVSLAAYLERARAAGVNIIYGSSLVGAALRVDVASPENFSLSELRDALASVDLELETLSADTYLIRRRQVAAADPAQVATATPVLEEVVVHSSVYRWTRRGAGGNYLANETLVQRPVLANDVMRVVNQLPGSASVSVSVRPRVRGGREDETLIEFDRVRLYNPFHFESYNSLYSAFDERLVADLAFYSGAYPLRQGDSLSAAMLISPPNGADLENRRELGLGLYQLSYLHSATSAQDSFLASLRRSGPETGHLLDEEALGHPEFADAFLRYERARDNGGSWSGNVLWYGDDLSLGGAERGETANVRYQSGYGWLSMESAPSTGTTVDTIVGVGYLNNRRRGTVTQPGKVTGTLTDDLAMNMLFANQDYTWGSDSRQLSAGWDYRYTDADFDVQWQREVAPAYTNLGNIGSGNGDYRGKQHLHQLALYGGWKAYLGDSLFIDSQVRLDAHRYQSRRYLEPSLRFGVLYALSPTLDLRAAIGRYSQAQALNELPVADLQTAIARPQAAEQFVLAVDWALPWRDIDLRIEAYRKDAGRVNGYFDNLANAYTLLPELQPDRIYVDADAYRASGIELSLDGPFALAGREGAWWLNYAFASADERTAGGTTPRGWDQGRTLNAGVQLALGRWQVALSGSFHEGWLTTRLIAEGDRVAAEARNAERFDHFLSLDAKVIRRWRLGKSELRVELGLSNVTDRDNIVGIDYGAVTEGSLTGQAFHAPARTAVADLYWSF